LWDTSGEGDVYLAWSPLAHAFGFTLNVFPMFLGAVVVFQEPTLTFRELKNVLETRNVTAMFCFPKIILRVFRDAKERKRTAGDWRRTYRFPVVNKILVGGQWIPEHLPKKLKDRFGCQRLWRYYGLTETLGVVIESEYTGNATRFRGFVAPKVRAKYMPSSDEYEPCPPGVDGELCVMSPTMMTGYYKCKEKAAAGGQPPQFGGGDKYGENTFLRTGDYGWCNHKGYIELHGKVGDIMSLSGLTVLPHELEDALRGLTFIKEICVFGSLSESVPGAAIVPKYDLDIEDSEAERQVADFLRRCSQPGPTGDGHISRKPLDSGDLPGPMKEHHICETRKANHHYVLKMIHKYATMFQDRGVGPGVHVWAMLSNSLENLAASLAVIFIGGVLYLTGYAETDDDTAKRLVDSAATFVLMEKKSLTRWYEDLVLGTDAGMIDTFALPDDAISFQEHIPVSAAEIAVVLHTSGYSASQKAVEITHKAYACAFESYQILAIIRAAHDKPIDELDIHKPHAFPPLKKIMIGGDVIPGSLPKLLLKNFHYQILHRYYGLTEAFGLVIVSGVGEKTGDFDGIPAPGCQIKVAGDVEGVGKGEQV
ncbi:hypothetical protein HPB47_020405, partial [Ixodes persulcatus]